MMLWLRPEPVPHGARYGVYDERGRPFPHAQVIVTERQSDGSVTLTIGFDKVWLLAQTDDTRDHIREFTIPAEKAGEPVAYPLPERASILAAP